MDTLTPQLLLEVGFVPAILIVGGWLYAGVLALLCFYYALLCLVRWITR
jgi:hypothetical protein